MTRYHVTLRDASNSTYAARATSIEEAAHHIARRLHGTRAMALRTTGTAGMSGYFQAYVPARGGGETSSGVPYHVTEE